MCECLEREESGMTGVFGWMVGAVSGLERMSRVRASVGWVSVLDSSV